MLLKIEGAKAGDQFTVYGFTRETMETQKPVSTITTGKASLEYGTTTKACPTGDAAPVAILAIAAAACVMLGLVVAAKKKKAICILSFSFSVLVVVHRYGKIHGV